MPVGYLMAIALPQDWSETWFAAFTAGLRADQDTFGISLFGGDTIRSGNGLMISLTAIGRVPENRMVPRGGARPGDRIYVSGTIGDAGLGLKLRRDTELGEKLSLMPADREALVSRYLLPQPRIALAEALRDHASAAMDVSDGLAGDLGHMCRASKLAARIGLAEVPMSSALRQAAKAAPNLLAEAVASGDDYELIMAVPPQNCEAFEKAASVAAVPVTAVGRFEAGDPLAVFLDDDGAPVGHLGRSYTHF